MVLPPGAAVVALDHDLTRVDVRPAERGLPLFWRAAPANAFGSLSTAEQVFTWRDVASRPWSPVHLRGRKLAGGGVRLRWIRRSRLGGDSWEGEPPLAEESERYRVEVHAAGAMVRAWDLAEPAVTYEPGEIAADFPGLRSASVLVEVRQGSARFGWGAPARRALLL